MNPNIINYDQLSFDYPFAFFALLIFIPLIILDIISDSRKYREKLPQELQKKIRYSGFMFGLFIIFSIIALSGPRWGMGYAVSEYRQGLDIVFAIDVSRSMDIRDAQAGLTSRSRLERGLNIASQSARSFSGARFAAVIGRSRGYLALPLTHDNEAFFGLMESLDGSSITGRSTNLEALVQAASDAFQISSPARKIIVLISDGESHSGSLRSAVNRCARDGIIINTIAVGSDDGRPIIMDTDNPQAGTAISRRDAGVMRMAAERTGGIYIDGSREDASSSLTSHLLSFAQEARAGSGKRESKQRRTFFIILALLSYASSKLIPLLPGKMLFLGKAHLVSMLACLFIFSSCTEGKLLLVEANYLASRGRYDEAIVPYLKALNHEDSAAYAEYGLGLTFHSLDENNAALSRYDNSQKLLAASDSSEHRELRYRNFYNSGIIFFEEGDYHGAAAAFKEALKADPRRTDAKRNLELSILSITMETERESRTESRQETREVLFDYIKQHEQQHWRSREWAPEEKHAGPDW